MNFQKNGSARALRTQLEYKALTEEKTVETVIIYFFLFSSNWFARKVRQIVVFCCLSIECSYPLVGPPQHTQTTISGCLLLFHAAASFNWPFIGSIRILQYWRFAWTVSSQNIILWLKRSWHMQFSHLENASIPTTCCLISLNYMAG